MAALFCLGMLAFRGFALRTGRHGGAELARLLWALYFALGLSALFIAATDVLGPVFPPNHASAVFLLVCVLVGIAGFGNFHARDVAPALVPMRHQTATENLLIGLQFYATLFFTPFAWMSFVGDANENRLDLASKMELLGSFGWFNTVAGAASHLFAASLVFACIRAAQAPRGSRNLQRAALLLLASLSYVVYVLAYVGRDGVVYWMMTALAVFVIFRQHLPAVIRRTLLFAGAMLAMVMLLPFLMITVARFADSDFGTAWSFLEYFGAQIHTFSDFSSIERPLTLGVMNFPMLVGAGCSAVGLACDDWSVIKEIVFGQYLAQGKEPWLFGTYVSDFVGDFGFAGALVALSLFALLCRFVCGRRGGRLPMTPSRLLLIMFLFLVPYWGVFYFRFGIINGFIVVNLTFAALVRILQGPARQRPSPRLRAAAIT